MAVKGSHVDVVGADETARLWAEYKRQRSPAAREALILMYAPLVRYVAGRVAVGLPPSVELDDLVSYGLFGLVDAIDKFDPARGVKFETYAAGRIRGAIIDGLRAADWVPRSVRQRAREVEQTVAKLEAELGRPPSEEEICRALGLKLSQYRDLLRELQVINLCSLDELLVGDDEDHRTRVGELVEDPHATDPVAAAATQEVKRFLAEAIDELPERERLVIALYYYEGLTLKEIGAILEVTESRVSQIHTQAILRLRSRLAQHREGLAS